MTYRNRSYETIEVRRKKRNWYLIGLLMGTALGFLIKEIMIWL
jgi:hypothetical protein